MTALAIAAGAARAIPYPAAHVRPGRRYIRNSCYMRAHDFGGIGRFGRYACYVFLTTQQGRREIACPRVMQILPRVPSDHVFLNSYWLGRHTIRLQVDCQATRVDGLTLDVGPWRLRQAAQGPDDILGLHRYTISEDGPEVG